MPRRTPDPEAPEDWDPAILTTGECAGVQDGAALKVRFERNSSRDVDTASLTIEVGG